MHPLIAQLMAESPVITDGAWGTQLQARGLAVGETPDLWNLSRPGLVEEVARSYVEAGSRVILTNTFRANRLALAGHGLAARLDEINQRGVEISRRAAGQRALVFASIGPCGKMLLTGEVSEEQLRESFLEQALALARGGPAALVIETMSDLAEARIAVAAARCTGLPVVCSMVFESGKQKDRTMMGCTPEQVAAELAEAGADVVGANCGQGIEGYLHVCRRLHEVSDRPIWIKANAGLPEVRDGEVVYSTTADAFARFGPALRTAGAAFLGGCCGTGPDFIRALKRELAT